MDASFPTDFERAVRCECPKAAPPRAFAGWKMASRGVQLAPSPILSKVIMEQLVVIMAGGKRARTCMYMHQVVCC